MSAIFINDALVTSAYVFSGSAEDDTTIKALNTAALAAVPEPATATLSLLALAGIAARRRRK